MGCEYVGSVWEYEGDNNTGGEDGGGLVVMSAEHEYMGGTCGSGSVSCADYMIEISLVRGMRGVGGLCEICM